MFFLAVVTRSGWLLSRGGASTLLSSSALRTSVLSLPCALRRAESRGGEHSYESRREPLHSTQSHPKQQIENSQLHSQREIWKAVQRALS